MTYSIRYAGSLESRLDSCGARSGHESIDAAVAAVCQIHGGMEPEEAVLVDVGDTAEDAVYVYASQSSADADRDGSSPIAVIVGTDAEDGAE